MGDSQHTQNIQISKVIDENEKCVFYFMEKKLNGLLGQPHTYRKSAIKDQDSNMEDYLHPEAFFMLPPSHYDS